MKTKNTNPVLFPHYFYLQVCFVGVIDKLIDIEKEEINYNFFENEINNTKLKVQIKNIYTIEYESEIYNILTKYKIKNYEINFNLYSGSNMYVIEYDKEKIKKYN